jgi:hypothetical protein
MLAMEYALSYQQHLHSLVISNVRKHSTVHYGRLAATSRSEGSWLTFQPPPKASINCTLLVICLNAECDHCLLICK